MILFSKLCILKAYKDKGEIYTMQQSDCKVLWGKRLEIIKDNLSEEQFNTWFRPIIPHSFNEKQELRIIVPSNFFGEYIEANFRQLLMSVVQRVMGKGVSLFY